MTIHLTVNGLTKAYTIDPDELLLDVLRRSGFTSVKKGCDTGSCGVCTVLLDGRPVPSCSLYAVKADGRSITTIEGVRSEAEEFARYLTDEGADQCGFCSPGLTLTILAMAQELKNPDDQAIRHYLSGNLCRCTGYVGQHRAIRRYLEDKE